MFKMLHRKGVVSWLGGLQYCKLNRCKNSTWKSYNHRQVFSFIEWCLCFLGSISTTQLNETRSNCIVSEEIASEEKR